MARKPGISSVQYLNYLFPCDGELPYIFLPGLYIYIRGLFNYDLNRVIE